MQKKVWFKAKNYGWGWYPYTWQGWLILGLWTVLILADFRRIDLLSHSASDTLMLWIFDLFFFALLLLWICWLTGEKLRRRWGGKAMF